MSACQSIPASLLHPLCTHPPLEVRNAELYNYWCPNAVQVDVTDFSYIHPFIYKNSVDALGAHVYNMLKR